MLNPNRGQGESAHSSWREVANGFIRHPYTMMAIGGVMLGAEITWEAIKRLNEPKRQPPVSYQNQAYTDWWLREHMTRLPKPTGDEPVIIDAELIVEAEFGRMLCENLDRPVDTSE